MNRQYSLVISPNTKTLSQIRLFQNIIKTCRGSWIASEDESGYIELVNFQASENDYIIISKEINYIASNLSPFQIQLDGFGISEEKNKCCFNLKINEETCSIIKEYGNLLIEGLNQLEIKEPIPKFQIPSCPIGVKITQELTNKGYRLLDKLTMTHPCFFLTMRQFDEENYCYKTIEKIPLLGSTDESSSFLTYIMSQTS